MKKAILHFIGFLVAISWVSVSSWYIVFAGYLDGYKANSLTNIQIPDMTFDLGSYGRGYQVTNTENRMFFIPTRTQNEWNLFKTNHPSSLSLCSLQDSAWSAWSAWSSCSATCGWGTTTRSRTCTTSSCSSGASCVGSSTESASCNTQSCAPYVPTCGYGACQSWTYYPPVDTCCWYVCDVWDYYCKSSHLECTCHYPGWFRCDQYDWVCE